MKNKIKLGSHVGMSGKEMFLGSVKEAIGYGSNTFMIYTGAPQNTKRKNIEELNIDAGWKLMKEHGIEEFIVHAPYIINLANTVKPEIFELAVEFLSLELDRTKALGSKVLVLHPGSHVGAGVETGIDQIARGLNEVLTEDMPVCVALETMAGKGSEIGRSFEEIARIYDKVKLNHKLRVCFDTCHVSDSGYDIVNDYEKVMDEFDHYIGKNQIAAFHINDSKNPCGAGKDRHENAGFGHIGFEALRRVIYDEEFAHIPKILESPYVPGNEDKVKTYPPYKYEIAMYRNGIFDPDLKSKIISTKGL